MANAEYPLNSQTRNNEQISESKTQDMSRREFFFTLAKYVGAGLLGYALGDMRADNVSYYGEFAKSMLLDFRDQAVNISDGSVLISSSVDNINEKDYEVKIVEVAEGEEIDLYSGWSIFITSVDTDELKVFLRNEDENFSQALTVSPDDALAILPPIGENKESSMILPFSVQELKNRHHFVQLVSELPQ